MEVMKVVTTKTKFYWKCPYCSEKYDSVIEVQNCMEECSDLESSVEGEENIYVCEYCNETYDREEDAIECEEDHIESQDKYNFEYEIKKSRQVLIDAAEHKDQIKLVVE